RTETSNLKRIFYQVLVAKTIIVVPLLAVLFSAWLLGWRPITSHGLSLFLFTSAYFLAFSYSPMWYFQGLERMSAPAALDVSLRSVGLIALLITVKHQNDFYLALVILALPPFVNTTVTLGWAWITCGRIKIDLIGAIKQLREGFHFFIYRGANSLAMAV